MDVTFKGVLGGYHFDYSKNLGVSGQGILVAIYLGYDQPSLCDRIVKLFQAKSLLLYYYILIFFT